jgi:hypothetical protein
MISFMLLTVLQLGFGDILTFQANADKKCFVLNLQLSIKSTFTKNLFKISSENPYYKLSIATKFCFLSGASATSLLNL